MNRFLPLFTGIFLTWAALSPRAHAQDSGFPGQFRPEGLAATPPPADARSGLVTRRVVVPSVADKPPTTAPEAAQQRLQRIKDKVQLGVPLSADETLFVMAWMQQNPFRLESAN